MTPPDAEALPRPRPIRQTAAYLQLALLWRAPRSRRILIAFDAFYGLLTVAIVAFALMGSPLDMTGLQWTIFGCILAFGVILNMQVIRAVRMFPA